MWAAARFSHEGIVNRCASCHDGARAPGKPRDHIPTHDRCEECHQVTRFRPARFSHAGIVSGCFTCHNGRQARGKHPNHIPSPNTCEICHNTTAWR